MITGPTTHQPLPTYLQMRRCSGTNVTFSSRMRRRLKDFSSTILSVALITTVFVYRATKVAQQEQLAAIHRRGLTGMGVINVTKTTGIREHKSFVDLWNPSPFQKAMFEPPIRNRYNERRARLEEKCPNQKLGTHWSDTMQLIAVPERHLTVCFVQKAGSTSWHKLIYKLRNEKENIGWKNIGHMENRQYARSLTREVKVELMNDPGATRVICARHPFARLVSGWNNKFHKNFLARAGNVMVKSMPDIVTYFGLTVAADPDHVISFQDFLQYIVDKGLSHMDVHFKSIDQLCQPCQFPYNVVVKAETAPEDLWWVLNRFNGTMESFPIHNIPDYGEMESTSDTMPVSSPRGTPSPMHYVDHKFVVDTIRRQFKTVGRDVIQKLMELYKADFDYFGYTFDIETLTAGGFY